MKASPIMHSTGVGSHLAGDCVIQALTNAHSDISRPYEYWHKKCREFAGFPYSEKMGGCGFIESHLLAVQSAISGAVYNSGIRGTEQLRKTRGNTLEYRNERTTLGQWLKTSEAQNGHWVVFQRGHFLAVINGVVYDSFRPTGKARIMTIYRIK